MQLILCEPCERTRALLSGRRIWCCREHYGRRYQSNRSYWSHRFYYGTRATGFREPLLRLAGCRNAMRKTLSIILALAACFGSHAALAQASNEVPHLIRVLVRPQAIAALRSAFAQHQASQPDIQRIILGEIDSIGTLLGLPPYFHIIRFAPFAAEHSAVFEDVRERLNPQLFGSGDRTDMSYRTNTPYSDLRSVEEKLSRWFMLEYSGEMSPGRGIFLASRSPRLELA